MYDVLRGMRVVECASFIAAPSCALHMQQLGAQVLRIDPIGGGPDYRRWPVSEAGDSFYWEGLNKGKQSIAIDLASPQGRELAVEIITAPQPSGGGLFVTNFPQQGFLSHEKLAKRRADLITVRVMGWSDGEPAVDYTVNAATGIPFMTGPEGSQRQPVNHVLPAWDLITGAYAAFAALAAERYRRETGMGQEVLVPLSDVAIASLGHMGQLAEVLTAGDRAPIGNALFGAFGRDFLSADGQALMVVAITARQWSGLLEALELRGRVADLECELQLSFAQDEGLRFQHRTRLYPLFEAAIGCLPLSEIKARFTARSVCWSPYRQLSQALQEEPRFSLQRELFSANLVHPSGHRYPAPGSAASFQGAHRLPLSPAPHLGAHTEEVLADLLKLSSSHIGELFDAGIVANHKV